MKEGKIIIGSLELPAFVALSEHEQLQGLMFVEPPFPAMVFPYKRAQVNKFWMNNVKAPLDIIFCRGNKIVNICRGEAYSTNIVGDDQLSDCIIELPEGSAYDFNLRIGDEIETIIP